MKLYLSGTSFTSRSDVASRHFPLIRSSHPGVHGTLSDLQSVLLRDDVTESVSASQMGELVNDLLTFLMDVVIRLMALADKGVACYASYGRCKAQVFRPQALQASSIVELKSSQKPRSL